MKGLLFTYALTYGGAVASLFRPFYGLLIYLCFAILRPEFLWSWSVSAGNYSRIVASALLLGWMLNGCGNWSFGRARTFIAILLLYWAWIVISATFAFNQTVAWDYVELHSKIFLPVFIGMTLIETVQQLKQLAWTIVLCLGYLAFDGNLDHLQGGFKVRLDGFGGMDNNSFCIAMAAGTGLAFFLGLHEGSWWRKLTCFGLAAMMAHVPMFAHSRGGMLGVLVTGVATSVVIRKRPFEMSLIMLSVVIGLRLAGPTVWERFETSFAAAEERDASAQSRLNLWNDCWEVMQKHPITGVGPDHWPLIAHEYGWPAGKECHSLWMNAGAELGFPGLTLLMLYYGFTIYQGWKMSRSHAGDDPWFADAGRMVVVALVGFVVAASFVSLDALEPPYYIALLGAGTLKVHSQVVAGASARPVSMPSSMRLSSTAS